MCSPSLAIASAGLGLQVVRNFKTGQANAAAAEQNADILEYNAKTAEYAALEETEIGREQVARHEQDLRQFEGSQLVEMGASGAVVGEGTFADIITDTARGGRADSLTIRSNSRRKASALRNQAKSSRFQAGFMRSAGSQSGFAGLLGGTGTLLTGAGSLALKYNKQ